MPRHQSATDQAVSHSGPKTRDADRSREAILISAEALFGERGFDAVSLNDIASAAGLSRGTPSYFFGSKAQLYKAVLDQVFGDRDEATREAFQPLLDWSQAQTAVPLERALTQAVVGYMEFLLSRPSFLRLVQREELAGGKRLRNTPRDSHAIEAAFRALRAVSRKRGLKTFEVVDAVLLFVSLTYSPLAQRSTFMASLGHDLENPTVRRKHVKLVVDQLLHLVRG
jgi:TetR/AcrR family transcriptional regulator